PTLTSSATARLSTVFVIAVSSPRQCAASSTAHRRGRQHRGSAAGYSDRRKFNRSCFWAAPRRRKRSTTPLASDDRYLRLRKLLKKANFSTSLIASAPVAASTSVV